MLLRISILSLCFILGVRSQENAASSVADSLRECYNKTDNLDRERRPPASINVLIELIRKIESGPSVQNDRQFSKEIIHRFKQDGIIRHPLAEESPYTVPFTPEGMQSDKHRILLKKLIPGSSTNFPNESLSEVERCSLHFMLSNTVDHRPRGDENRVCNKIGRYEMRVRRDADPNNDVEIFNPSKSSSSKGNLQDELDEQPQFAEDQEHVETGIFKSSPDISTKKIEINLSDCPIEDGTVYTHWGTIQAGTVLSGIAAGREPQNIKSKENYVVDNRFAATLAGDLAEVGLHQGARGKDDFDLGAKGGWNDTQAPRWYFINKKFNLQMTDAEIRGGLDGLIIATNIEAWHSKASTLKISQILDMYYSPKGVFSKKYRACNRQLQMTEVAQEKKLIDETIAFSFLLNDEAKLSATITPEGIKAYGNKAVKALNLYIPTNLRDLSCPVENETIMRVSTDIIIVVDTQWDYNIMQRTLANLLDNLDVNQYGSNFTIIGGQDGKVLVNSSRSILNFYSNYNRTTHTQNNRGFDVRRAFNVIEEITKRKMDEDKLKHRAGGQSSIALFMPYNPAGDTGGLDSTKQNFKTFMPDLKLLALGRNSKDGYSNLVFDPSSDAFGLPESTDGASITDAVKAVVARIKQIHRRIINPSCGSGWSGDSNPESFDEYVEPNGVNYYHMLPNYFFGEGTRTVKFQRLGYGNLVACTSRQNSKPSNNFQAGDVKCEPISTNEVSFSFTDGCSAYKVISECPPAYFSVTANETGQESYACTDSGCRFPDNVKYTIKLEGLGCANGSYRIIANFIILLTAVFTLKCIF